MIAILDNIRSALNVGSIIRTSEALGVEELWLCGITPDTKNTKVLKTSLGSEKHIKTESFSRTDEAVEKAKKHGLTIVALEITKGSLDIQKFIPPKNCALVVGNEVSGIDNSILNTSDMAVSIPMKGKKESLNVAVAYGIAISYIKLFNCNK